MARKLTPEQEKAIWAHRMCCPYWSDQVGRQSYMGEPIKCGANQVTCDNDCWYMKTFEMILLGKQKLPNPAKANPK